MEYTVCSVVCVNRRWFADCGPTRHGPYTSAETATRVAITEAQALQSDLRRVKVSIHRQDGSVFAEYFFRPEPKPAEA